MIARPLVLFAPVLCIAAGAAGYATLTSRVTTEQSAAAAPASGPQPRAALDHDSFDFGVIAVGEEAQHTFLLRNDGNAPLSIEATDTSCKCTMVAAPDGMIAPGESTPVRLEWSAPEPVAHFRHGAVLITNDPEHPRLLLRIEGAVRAAAACWPDAFVFSDMLRNESRTQSLTVYSQIWSDFEIDNIACNASNTHWTIELADPETVKKLRATSARSLSVTAEPGLPLGMHQIPLTMTLRPADGSAPRCVAVELGVEVVGEFSIFGAKVEGKTLQIGAVSRQRGARDSLWMYVRGDHADVQFDVLRTDPQWLRVEISRDKQLSGRTARYRVDVEIPAGANLTDRITQAGRVQFKTDHPDWPEVGFDVHFAVVE